MFLPSDDKGVSILLCGGMVDPASVNAGAFLSGDADRQVKEFVTGNHFLNKLGERHPNLKVKTPLPIQPS